MRSSAAPIALAAAMVTVGIAAAAAAAGGVPASVGNVTTTIGGPPPSTTAAAADTDEVVDDTGGIRVSVPSTWTDRETAPQMADDGSDRPKITAAPDIAAMNAGWDVPGIWFGVVPSPADPDAWLQAYAFDTECSRGPSEPFDNGTFVGTTDTWTSCGGGATQLVQVGARTADGSAGIFVQVQVTTPGDPYLDVVLQSLGVVPGETLAPSPQPVDTTTVSTVGPADQTLLSPVAPIDATRVVDDTNRFAMALPAAFSDHASAPGVNDDASARPMIGGAPDLDAFYARWDGAGIEAVLLPAIDPASLLANRALPCDDGGIRPFSNARFSGLVQTWNACGGTPTRVVQLALAPPDRSVTILVYAQLPDADTAPLAAVLDSLELL